MAVVMIVTLPGENNTTDQRMLEYKLWDNHKIAMIRRTLADIGERGKLNANKSLEIDGHEVAVSYFRAGYDPEHYPTNKLTQGMGCKITNRKV